MVNYFKLFRLLPRVIYKDYITRKTNPHYWDIKDNRLKNYEFSTRIRRKATNTYHKYKSMSGKGPYRNVKWPRNTKNKFKQTHKHKFVNYKLT